ncbi:3',5'-cyclic-AMP phosphodiesterase 4C-like isoform X3 [Rhopilema esculentum]|uniref:3',5'-cyclic-AMP phosphodiesterase 4C-like isoform X3 n=1 Tax=Rhopilema esculentum TaxID=499914 RepID=UPI0031D998E8
MLLKSYWVFDEVSLEEYGRIDSWLAFAAMNEKKNVKSALCEMVLPVISLSVSNADQEEDAESLSPESSRLHGDAEQHAKQQTSPLNEHDRLQLPVSGSRRESFLYRSDSDCDNPPPPLSSRSSISSEGVRSEELVTPFAQVLSCLQNIRSNFVLLTNVRQSRHRRGSDGFHLNSRVCNLYETGDGSFIRDDMFKKLTMETLKEFDWCLNQLECLQASMTISDMASNKFRKILNRELKENSEAGNGASEISAWVYNTFIDKPLEDDIASNTREHSGPIRARSRSLVRSIKKLTRSISCSGSIPRFGVECPDEAPLEKIMEDLDKWNFDVFKVYDVTASRPLLSITYTILQTRDLLKTFKIKPSVFVSYMSSVENHYLKDVAFHNSTHAADVTQATHFLLSATAFQGVFSDLEVFAAIFASAVHDVDHPGVNNQFLVDSNSEMAIIYNDESVLENHHLAVAFQLLQHEECDIFQNLSKKERQMLRKMTIEMVLATDNAKHMSLLAALKTMVETKSVVGKHLVLDAFNDRLHILKCLVHCSDLSNPTRPLRHYQKWLDRLMEEFFTQGDIEREKGMDVSPMMDRHNANIAKSQVVFIDYVVHPLWETWADLVYPDAQELLDNLNRNRDWYKLQCSPSTTTSPKSSPNMASLRRVSLQLENSVDDSEENGLLEAKHGDERRKSDSLLLKKPPEQTIDKVQKQLQELACGKEREKENNCSSAEEPRTMKNQNGTVVKSCDKGNALPKHSSPVKHTVNSSNDKFKEKVIT